MEVVEVLPSPRNLRGSDEFADIAGKFANDFMAKVKIDDENVKNEDKQNDKEAGEDEDEDFSFVLATPEGSPISADEVFDNGQIRPIFPVFNQDLIFADGYDGAADLLPPIKKVFVEQPKNLPSASESNVAPEGPYCEWAGKTAVKSNSTGFSKLWRLRDLKLRSNSDGKDAFVFLNASAASGTKPGSSGAEAEKSDKAGRTTSGEVKNVVVKKVKAKTASSAHEKHYVMNRARKESDKRKSYLPYRQELVGFFANVNGLSRNVHPF